LISDRTDPPVLGRRDELGDVRETPGAARRAVRPGAAPIGPNIRKNAISLPGYVGEGEDNRDRWCAQRHHAISNFDIGDVMGTNVTLTPELERFAQACVERGRFNNVSEVVRSALRMLQEAEERRAAFVASWKLRARKASARGWQRSKRSKPRYARRSTRCAPDVSDVARLLAAGAA